MGIRKDDGTDRALQAGMALEGIERHSSPSSGDVVVTGFSVRMAGDCLITLRAVVGREKRVVGFIGGVTIATAVVKAADMLREGTVDWKPDRFQ